MATQPLASHYINLQIVFFFDTPKNPDHVLSDRIYGTMQRLA